MRNNLLASHCIRTNSLLHSTSIKQPSSAYELKAVVLHTSIYAGVAFIYLNHYYEVTSPSAIETEFIFPFD